MACRDFERATPNRIASGTTGWASGLTTPTFAAVVTVESLPGAGAYHTMISATSGTAARQMYLGIAGDGGNALSVVHGATQVDFGAGSGLVPTADGRWYLFASTKQNGNVAPIGYMYDFLTCTLTTATAGATTNGRTAGAVTMNVGSGGTADYWDGKIAMAAMFNRVLTEQQILQLRHPTAWAAAQLDRFGCHIDLTWKSNVIALDYINPSIAFTAGTDPGVNPDAPPGWR